MGLIAVRRGDVAAVVTSLEMTRRPSARPLPASPLMLRRWTHPAPDKYRALYRRVGQPWLWFSRLVMDDATLLAAIHDDAVEVYAVVDRQGIEIGLLELDFRSGETCRIVFLGLVPELTGRGHGKWLMAQAMSLCWRRGIGRVRVNTCTLDHPSALGYYMKSGFSPYDRMVETFRDPRLEGIYPRDVAPQIPLLD